MNALDMLDDSFPHGTVEGFNLGCKGSHCPAPMACRDVRTRYHADWGFRKAVDAGMTAAQLLEREQADAAAAAESDRVAAAAERQAQLQAARTARASRRAPRATRSPRVPRATRETKAPTLAPEVARLHAEGLSDRKIGEQLGISRPYVAVIRNRLGLAPLERTRRRQEPNRPREDRRPEVTRLHALGMRDDAIAEQMGLSVTYVGNLRRDLGLPTHPLPRAVRAPREPRRVDRRPDIAAAHAEGLTDRQIGERVGLSPSEVGRLRRDLGLQVHKSRASRWDNAERLPHGTNASYARGCRCQPCHKAQREYYREYSRRRRAEGIPNEHHGTPYGYQLGCRGRKACPATTTCTDAMLEQERRRRREAGIPAAADRVPAEPVRDHVRQLMEAGMSVLGIAETAGVSKSGIKTLLYGRTGARAGEFPAHIEADKANRLLALEAS